MPPSTASASCRSRAATSSAIRDILEHARRPGVISLAGGIPAPESFALEALQEATVRAIALHGADAVQYGLTHGEPWFRAWAAEHTGSPTDPDSVVVTTGSQQALDLLAWTLLDPGEVVVVGDPDYLGALQVFRRHGARLHPVPVGPAGLDLDRLEADLRAGLRPRACYLAPTHHNPTGTTLDHAGRTRVVDLADRYGFTVVEDDPYRELSYDGPAPDPLPAHPTAVVRVRSVSKFVAPGLRLGWIVAPAWLHGPLVRAKQATDLHTSTFAQAVVTHLHLPAHHLDTVRDRYRARRDAMVAAVAEDLPAASCTHPSGGMFCWVDLGRTTVAAVDTASLLPLALEAGVAYVPGAAFSPTGGRSASLRLSFATVDPDTIANGVRRLAAVVQARGG